MKLLGHLPVYIQPSSQRVLHWVLKNKEIHRMKKRENNEQITGNREPLVLTGIKEIGKPTPPFMVMLSALTAAAFITLIILWGLA